MHNARDNLLHVAVHTTMLHAPHRRQEKGVDCDETNTLKAFVLEGESQLPPR